jgi:hypothetical protein
MVHGCYGKSLCNLNSRTSNLNNLSPHDDPHVVGYPILRSHLGQPHRWLNTREKILAQTSNKLGPVGLRGNKYGFSARPQPVVITVREELREARGDKVYRTAQVCDKFIKRTPSNIDWYKQDVGGKPRNKRLTWRSLHGSA